MTIFMCMTRAHKTNTPTHISALCTLGMIIVDSPEEENKNTNLISCTIYSKQKSSCKLYIMYSEYIVFVHGMLCRIWSLQYILSQEANVLYSLFRASVV